MLHNTKWKPQLRTDKGTKNLKIIKSNNSHTNCTRIFCSFSYLHLMRFASIKFKQLFFKLGRHFGLTKKILLNFFPQYTREIRNEIHERERRTELKIVLWQHERQETHSGCKFGSLIVLSVTVKKKLDAQNIVISKITFEFVCFTQNCNEFKNPKKSKLLILFI